eukprot:TRINITY_DN219_c0_g1_i1.p1 TRINITY_DN219_c0_g1~~TRINITY_DN219_c0_g1_i1.p1  ORF type:complete len:192 (+),score=54.40 TRINITY_DN219_c0_g1_i1:46-576(+)
MWKLKMAKAAVTGGNPLSKATTNFKRWARIVGLVTSGLFVLMGALCAAFSTLWVGIYSIVISPFIFLLELPWAPFDNLVRLQNIPRKDFRWKIGFFLIISVLNFFDTLTIIAALSSVATAGCYAFCYFKGEEEEDLKRTKLFGIGPDEDSSAPASDDTTTNNKKKKSLASKDETMA